jgi:hypothetical protein
MKHRNKRIGLNSDLFTHLSYLVQNGLSNKNREMQKGPKGQNGGKGTIPAEFNSYSGVKF